VALSCCFADQSHFSKAFRRAFGVASRSIPAHASLAARLRIVIPSQFG
jgi:AraC-like DNA-binding protein